MIARTLQTGDPVTYHGSVTEAHGEWEFVGGCGSQCGCAGSNLDGSLRELQFVLRRPGVLLNHVDAENFIPIHQSKEN